MSKLAILLLLAAPVLAQDDAAALFYKGFWLEQAEGKLDEAAALYAQLLKEKPDAPEAPRALLGLVRIKAARNEDANELVAELERRYPAAKDEIAGAKRVAVREEFTGWPPKPADTPVVVKLKTLHLQMNQVPYPELSVPDKVFLIDLGAAAHPMLAKSLRASNAQPAEEAAGLLLSQHTPEAYALLSAALLDDTALFRSAIIQVLASCPEVPTVIVDALERLYDRSPPRLRSQTVETLVKLVSREGEGRDRAFAMLTRVLSEDDQGRRIDAAQAIGTSSAPDAYVDAVLRGIEAGDLADNVDVNALVQFADRAAFRERIEKILEGRTLTPGYLPNPLSEEAALLLVRKVIRDTKAGIVDPHAVGNVAIRAAQSSPRAAGALLTAALDLNDATLAAWVKSGLDQSRLGARKYLGEEANKLRAAALALAPGLNETDRPACVEMLRIVGIGAEDFPSVVEALRRRGKKRVPVVLLSQNTIRDFGPANAGALVEFCADERDVASLLTAGSSFRKRDDGGVDFYRQVVPKAGPTSADWLLSLAELPTLAPLVAERLLTATEPEWKWGAPLLNGMLREGAQRDNPGPFAWSGIRYRAAAEPLRSKLLPYVDDQRPEIAISAACAAAAEESEAGAAALRLALDSKIPAARGIALEALATRVADGPALVREFARRSDLTDEDRGAVSRALLQGPAYAPVAAELLRLGTWPYLWSVYQQIAPKECVQLALAAAGDDRAGGDQRLGALSVLVTVDDPRRIEVFRKILKGTDGAAIMEVLCAVRDQYLVELGEEALAQLRNPDGGIRATATEAIDRLKFYAEAKKAFQK